MKRPFVRYTLGIILLFAILATPLQAKGSPSQGIRLVALADDSITLSCAAPSVTFARVEGAVRIQSDWPLWQVPGEPLLPYMTALVALPPEGEITATLELSPSQSLPLPAPVAVLPQEEGVSRQSGEGAPLRLDEVATMRGVRLGRIVCAPFRVEGDALLVTPQATLTLRWHKGDALPLSAGERPFAPLRQVLNPEHLALKRRSGPEPHTASAANGPEALLHIAQSGLYRLTYADLAPFGLGGGKWDDLHLWQGDEEIALDVQEDGDGYLEPAEACYFFAEPRPSRWEAGDVLRVTRDVRTPLRMGTRTAAPEGALGNVWLERTWEENVDYAPDRLTPALPLGRDGDRWFWAHLQRPSTSGEESATVSLSLYGVATSLPADLTLWLVGQTSLAPAPDHRVAVRLNGVSLGEITWDGRTAITQTLAISAGILQEGANTLRLDLVEWPGVAMDALWLDAFALRYALAGGAVGSALFEGEVAHHRYALPFDDVAGLRAYDVTSPRAPQKLAGWQVVGNSVRLGDPPIGGPRRYWVGNTSGILAPTRLWAPRDPWAFQPGGEPDGADLLIITHPDFAASLAPLRSAREAQGLRTAIVNVEGIYDRWGEGRMDPQAIVRFVRYAYEAWQPRPRYLLLVGDGSFDPRRYRADSPPTFIPPYLLDVPPRLLETAADNRYACVDGADALPDLAVGRLPVRSAAEASAYIAKLGAYAAASAEGAWRQRAALVADDPDTGGDFTAFSEANAARFSVSWEVQRLHCLGVAPDVSDCTPAEVNALRQALGSYWRQGMGLVEYTGHSSWHQWAVERFLHIEEVPGLTANGRWPIVASWTCFTSAFHRPEWVLDERLVMDPQAGAIATWGPASLGTEPAHRTLADGFHEALLGGPVSTLGEAADAGKLALFIKGPEFDLLDTYTLLGDPSLRPAFFLPAGESRYFLPLIRKR